MRSWSTWTAPTLTGDPRILQHRLWHELPRIDELDPRLRYATGMYKRLGECFKTASAPAVTSHSDDDSTFTVAPVADGGAEFKQCRGTHRKTGERCKIDTSCVDVHNEKIASAAKRLLRDGCNYCGIHQNQEDRQRDEGGGGGVAATEEEKPILHEGPRNLRHLSGSRGGLV